MQQPVFEVGVAELAGVVVAQHTLDWAAGSTSPTTLKTASSSRASRISWSFSSRRWRTRPSMVLVATKLKIRQSLRLAVAVDAAHPLFEAVRVPGDVVVEQDVADTGG